jgi:cell fate regulator YaaT (PSP1 superfamily)
MVEIVGVGFMKAGKTYYFDPEGEKYEFGDLVIVETARGMELGHIAIENTEIDEKDLVAPLKGIERRADDKDMKRYRDNLAKRENAMKVCQQKIEKHNLDMKLIDAEYTIDGSKVIFYFSADGRVDFRELVKDLASYFHMRIELRQIGVRDEAKMLGGIGICGRPLCCSRWLNDFQPVSIKMAKQQNLSLNPAKISGTCGRLMCCLNFENKTYQELRKGMPNDGERIKTPDGIAKVVNVDLFTGRIITRAMEKDPETGEITYTPETKVYFKNEIKRMDKKHHGKKKNDHDGADSDDMKGLDEETRREIEELTKD